MRFVRGKILLNSRDVIRTLLALVISLAVLLIASVACPQDQGLRILSVDPWLPQMAPAYLKVEIDYPMDFEGAAASLAVNGRETAFESLGWGSGGGRRSASYAIAAGEPGRKTVTVTLKAGERKLVASRTVEFRSQGGAGFLNYSDGEAIWQRPKVQVFVYFLQNPRLTLNGRQVAFEQVPDPENSGHSVISVKEGWQAGLNRLEFKGTNTQGQEVAQKITLFWIKDGIVKQGDAFLLFLGYMGSKSGPFYYLKATGPALARGPSKWGEIFLLEAGRWLRTRKKLLQEVRAQAPGKEVITILVKKYFLQGVEVDRQFILQVVP
jgi:hypothetical protein